MNIWSNIWKIFCIRAIRWFLLIMPIITVFYTAHGLSLHEIFLIQAIFSLSVVLFEIPSGYFADVIWRKKSIIIGLILWAAGMGVYCLASGFYWFLLAELTLGLGSSFLSGADVALLYDTLLDEGRVDENKKIQWYFQSISSGSEALGAIFWWLLASVSLVLPFYVEFFLLLLSIPLWFLLYEPKHHKLQKNDGVWKGILRIVKYSLHEHKEVKWLILFSGIFGASTLVMTWMLQSYFTQVWVPIIYFGILWSVFTISLIPFSLLAHLIEKKIGMRNSFFLLAFLPVCGYFILGVFHSIFALGFALCFYMARGFGSVILSDYINHRISSDIRATVLSVQALAFRLVFVIVWPIVGWVNDIYSLSTALLFSAGLFSLLFLIPLFFLQKYKVIS